MGHMEESSNFHSKLAYFEILDKDIQQKNGAVVASPNKLMSIQKIHTCNNVLFMN